MSNYFTLEEEQQKMFTQLPKALLYETEYKPMKNDSKLLYSFLLDRTSNSLRNKWVDEQGRVYIKCSEIAMGEILNKTEKTVRRFKNELIEKGLLEYVNVSEDKTMYYVKKPNVTVENIMVYIDGFNEVVGEKSKKEKERNKEYRLRVARGELKKLKQQHCNGKNDRSIENTGFEVEETLEPLQSLDTVEITGCDQSKLPFSNNDFSYTDSLGMYVCNDARACEEKSAFIKLAKENQITFSPEYKEFIESYEEVFEYELYEYIFFEVLNKFRNGRVSNFERYLLSALDTQSSKNNYTLSDYVTYKQDFNETNFKRKDYKNPNYKKPATKSDDNSNVPNVKKQDEPVQPVQDKPVFVPQFEEPTPIEEVPTVSEVNELEDTPHARIRYRQKHGLTDSKYFNHTLKQLQEIVADIEKRKSMVETLMESYNKDMFDEETRRRFAIHELNLENFYYNF